MDNDTCDQPEPTTPPRRRLTRDQRRDVQLLRQIGWKYDAIATHLSISVNAVRYALTKDPTPQHFKAGRPAKLSNTQVDDLIAWISSSTRNQRLPLHKVTAELYPDNSVSVEAVRYALRKRGYKR